MAYVSGAGGPAVAGLGSARARNILGAVAQIVGQFGAAIRISAAVEARKQPDLRDLKILGLEGALPLPR